MHLLCLSLCSQLRHLNARGLNDMVSLDGIHQFSFRGRLHIRFARPFLISDKPSDADVCVFGVDHDEEMTPKTQTSGTNGLSDIKNVRAKRTYNRTLREEYSVDNIHQIGSKYLVIFRDLCQLSP